MPRKRIEKPEPDPAIDQPLIPADDAIRRPDQAEPRLIAEREEVLACLTACMRGQDISRMQAHAAEVLARILGMFGDGQGIAAEMPCIVDDIPREGRKTEDG